MEELDPGTVSLGVRELRNQVAAAVRRAGGGERVVITVDGRPSCQLGPIEPCGPASLADLVAAGLVDAPAGTPRPAPDPPALRFAVDTRPDRLLREVRGR